MFVFHQSFYYNPITRFIDFKKRIFAHLPAEGNGVPQRLFGINAGVREQLTEKVMIDTVMPLGYLTKERIEELSVLESCRLGNSLLRIPSFREALRFYQMI